MSVKHYDVYKNNVCIFESETAAVVIKYLKINKDQFYKAVKGGKQINGCDVYELDDGEPKKPVPEEDKAAKKFINVYGISVYREWLTMNIRYGGWI